MTAQFVERNVTCPTEDDESDVVQIIDATIGARPNPQSERFRFLDSFRQDGVLPMRWREAA